ncbi:MAG: D-alanine--D-alanine ligase [Bacteroidales bacterium]|nr:D-alanine--D-alanine ligase [Bacteroidales bacterium]MBR4089135.1 D-alanine--D-alanine ligase [Bacteroidales bacterium]
MKKSIALIYGGNSEEAGISVQSGKNVSGNICREEYDVYEVLLKGMHWRVLNPSGGVVEEGLAERGLENPSEVGVEVDKTDFSFVREGKRVKFDMAFIMIHGNPGENGLLQGYLEMMGVPYNTCSAYVSAITFDKHSCKRFIEHAGIKMAKDVFLRRGTAYNAVEIVEELGLPVFVKPTNGGSSFGITKVKRVEDLEAAVELAFREYDSVIIEESIVGRELTNGIYQDGEQLVKLPVTEIVTTREFFDYEAKYLGESQEICPAQIPCELTLRIQETTEKIYRYMGCSGLVRMDYIVRGEEIFFLETNTVPGMTPMSLVPAQVRAAGIPMSKFFSTLIENIR